MRPDLAQIWWCVPSLGDSAARSTHFEAVVGDASSIFLFHADASVRFSHLTLHRNASFTKDQATVDCSARLGMSGLVSQKFSPLGCSTET